MTTRSGSRRRTVAVPLVATLALVAALLALWSPAASAAGDNPWTIDGVVADAGALEFGDPYGDVKELGSANQSTAKLLNIHSDAVDTLAFTNPNAQTDLRRVWLGTKKDVNGDTWLYFAWERDANNGSGQISYEFQLSDRPAACDYGAPGEIDMVEPEEPAETALIDGCNPWDNRAAGDFSITWDWSGSSTEIWTRTFTGSGSTYGLASELATNAEAKFSADKFRGEAAINLSEEVFPADPTSCLTVANIIPSTITGNSDQADYKDILLADTSGVYISSCGGVTVTKRTSPAGLEGDFDVELDRNGGGPVGYSPDPTGVRETTLVDDGGTHTFTGLPEGSDYTLDETSLPAGFELDDITCGATEQTATSVLGGTFSVSAGVTTNCWVYNDYPLDPLSATITGTGTLQEEAGWQLQKSVLPDSWEGELGEELGTSDWTVTATKTPSATRSASGSIVVTNDNPVSVAVDSVTATLGGAAVTVVCPALTVAADDTLTCTWSASPAAQPTALAATVDATDGQYGTAAGALDTTAVGTATWTTLPAALASVTLEDDRFTHSETISATTVEEFPEPFSCPSDVSVYTEGVYTETVVNTAELLNGATVLDQQSAQVDITCSLPPALEVSPGADGEYDSTASWSLVKTVDDAEHSGEAGETAGSSTWSVTATKTVTDSGYQVDGTVVISNADDEDRTITGVGVTLDDGTPVTVSCLSLTVPAEDTLECTFSATPDDATATLATVTVTGDVLPVGQTTAPVTWVAVASGDDSVHLVDERVGYDEIVDETTSLTFPETFTCPVESDEAYVDGVAERTEENVATATGDSTDLEDAAEVDVVCVLPPALEVQPGAGAEFDRIASWSLEKSVDDAEHSGDAGESVGSSTWTVTATKTVTDSGFQVDGSVVISNADDEDRTIGGVDVALDDGTPVTVDCLSLTVPAEGTLECAFSATPDDASATLATVTVTGDVLTVAQTTAPISWVAVAGGDDSVRLVDERVGYDEVVDETTSLEFPEPFTCPTDESAYTDGSSERTEVNVVTATGESTDLEDSAQVTVDCTLPEVLPSVVPTPTTPRVLPFVAPPAALPTTGAWLLLPLVALGSGAALVGSLLVGAARRRDDDD